MNLLIVDDERNIRVYMQRVLEKMSLGFTTIKTAQDGYEALEIAKTTPPDIIITDVVMPWLSGHELVAALKEINPYCVYIFISGHDDVAYLQEAIVLQVFRYILKPISIQELTETLNLAIKKVNTLKEESFSFTPDNFLESSLDTPELSMQQRLLLIKVKSYVEKNYMHNIGSRDIAAHCGISTGYLSSLFSVLPNVSVPQYITDVRLKYAFQLLKDEVSISIIAERCGFSSANYFTKVFKSKYKKTPREMRMTGFHNEKDDD